MISGFSNVNLVDGCILFKHVLKQVLNSETVKNKFKNIRNEHLRSIYKNTNFILPLKQPKHLYRELTSPRFISSFKNIRKPVPYKCNDKRCKLCPNYLNKTNKFTMSNVQVWKIRREIDCH